MIAYSTLIELETNLIRIDSIRKTMEAVAAGIATIPSEDAKTDILYFLSESLGQETELALDKFQQAFEAIREYSYRPEENSIDNS
jgi:hypothetical protein